MDLLTHASNNKEKFDTDELRNHLETWKINDVVILRGGSLLWEWHDKNADRVSAIYSCTKSILSALIGIAIGHGHINSIDDPIADYFSSLAATNDQRKRSIRIKHLLSMTSGLEWPDFDKPYWTMKRADDWISFILSQPMAHEPGEAFAYNSGGSHLLSAILTQATGTSAYAYAEEHLFHKLGFRKPRWNSHDGIYEGGAGLHMTSRDMANFGQLYLQGGLWEGEQVIPRSWVETSTSVHHKGLAHYEPPIFGEYGYHWWISTEAHNGVVDYCFAKGYGGQYIFIVPSYDLVAAIRKEPEGKSSAMAAKELLFQHILPFCS
ncbi:serine hydrolase [Paenibacillus sp. CF384]|uniref:serine hydrolase domain-containing protein n=1 Tax=Paenibacillus sp. CF384 TaxID=1884382 RepID=UPI00089B3020|nr:serine hydrolase [Paenibacillus sp. CF384]SDX52175.1 CubicO group peptidase, beta-lactamase class C family [Paenibacillus sp. CF384]